MTMVFGFFKKNLIDVIDWTEQEAGILAFRFPIENREIQNGAKLTVRDTQIALFINEGEIADLFGPGLHTLETKNLPVLTSLNNWDKGFSSPFKSDIYFYSTKEQIDQKWGTATPITVRDKDYGVARIRAYGSYSYKIKNPRIFYQKISGTKDKFYASELEGQLKAIVLTAMASFFGKSQVSFLDMSANQESFSALLNQELQDEFENYGLKLETFLVQSISLPEEIQNQISSHKLDSKLNSASPQVEKKNPVDNLKPGNALGDEVLKTINQLYELKSKGILSETEFEAKKTELLKRL